MQDHENVHLVLDEHSGSGFKSKESYYHGFFSASIKLPANYSAGVVTAFYTSNAENYPQNHDELDFEFLGVVPGMPYTMQTNIYGNGSVGTGREERIHLWFDPTADYHKYSVLWNEYHIVFFVDDIPIRQMIYSDDLGGQYPSKPMFLYATIWDGSLWATEGGKYPVEYSKGPFIASFKDFKLHGCELTPSQSSEKCFSRDVLNQLAMLSAHKDLHSQQKDNLKWARSNYMFYSYCDDVRRYPEPLPDCRASRATPKLSGSISRKKRNKLHRQHKEDPARSKKDLDHSSSHVTSVQKEDIGQRAQLLSETNIRRRLVTTFSSKSASNNFKFADLPPSLRIEQRKKK
ncbi:hypothetical protein O6H91_07G122600 [Diphasiastrum complanatum]|nr:hypothetical protein O6H91_07G122600 [Diphasiastrum complanatum]KAJ7550874.1 hypothetical protein O6H91_07G122600 [Diphasiastrum complanatum]KAJ7550875.1 hypothetical protein O6H91_07G122600 [Diphasiastrum complanatum]